MRPYDNVPVLSWLLLRGHCRSCHAAISPRYPLIEGLTAALCIAVVLAHETTASGIALGIGLVLVVVPAAVIDVDIADHPQLDLARGRRARDRAGHRTRPER